MVFLVFILSLSCIETILVQLHDQCAEPMNFQANVFFIPKH